MSIEEHLVGAGDFSITPLPGCGESERIVCRPLSALGLVEFASFETQPMGGITYQETYFLEPTAATDESLHFPGLFARMVHF